MGLSHKHARKQALTHAQLARELHPHKAYTPKPTRIEWVLLAMLLATAVTSFASLYAVGGMNGWW